ncbi:DUF742 domain-containing protein [Streptomyces sp. NPDC053474]|uniref:DUF742 domain-containing protein n=1 Tax=Streptomyces sp. NPDC053474 TaxID=3365704 RepID=UPI0037CD78C9
MEDLTEDTVLRGPVRPYALLGGQPRPDRYLDPGVLLTRSARPPKDHTLRPFHAELLSCWEGTGDVVLSVTEIAHGVGTTLQQAGMGLADLMHDGYLISPTPKEYADGAHTKKELLHRVLDGLRAAQ